MTTRQKRHRDKRIAAGYQPVYLLLSGDAVMELDRRRNEQGITRVQLAEQWLKKDFEPDENTA